MFFIPFITKFVYPWALWGIPFVCGFFLLRRWLERRRAYLYSDTRLLAPSPWWVRTTTVLSTAALLGAMTIGVVASARPIGTEEEVVEYEFVRRGCVVLDISGSMSTNEKYPDGEETRIVSVVKAGKEFVKKRKGDALCLVPFESSARLDLAISLTDDADTIPAALDDLQNKTGGATALGDGMFYALAVLVDDVLPEKEGFEVERLLQDMKGERKEGKSIEAPYVRAILQRTGRFAHAYITVLSDADYNEGIIDPLRLLEVIERFGIRVYVIGVAFDYSTFPEFIHAVRRTDGEVFFAKDSRHTDQLLEKVDTLEKRKVVSKILKRPKELSLYFMKISIALLLFFVLLRVLLMTAGTIRILLQTLFRAILRPRSLKGGIR